MEDENSFGEISLAGEIRAVSNSKQRHAEAVRLGHDKVVSAEGDQLSKALSKALS